jgi:hypothetical protein
LDDYARAVQAALNQDGTAPFDYTILYPSLRVQWRGKKGGKRGLEMNPCGKVGETSYNQRRSLQSHEYIIFARETGG